MVENSTYPNVINPPSVYDPRTDDSVRVEQTPPLVCPPAPEPKQRTSILGKFWERHRPSIPLTSLSEYYALMRLAGYVFQADYSDIARGMVKRFNIANRVTTQDIINNYYSRHPEETKDKTKSQLKDFEQLPHDEIDLSIAGAAEDKAKKYTNRIEGVTFLGLTIVTTKNERRKIINELAETVAQELDIPCEKIGIRALRKSKNPIVDSAVDRFFFRAMTRSLSDSMFFKGLKWGIVGKAINITLERSVFIDKDAIAFDHIKHLIHDVHDNNLTHRTRDGAVERLVKAYQQSRRDHHLPNYTQEQIEGMTPTLEAIADAIIARRVNLAHVVHIMGGGLMDPNDPETSLKNVTSYIGPYSNKPRATVADTWPQPEQMESARVGLTVPQKIVQAGPMSLLDRASEQAVSATKGM